MEHPRTEQPVTRNDVLVLALIVVIGTWLLWLCGCTIAPGGITPTQATADVEWIRPMTLNGVTGQEASPVALAKWNDWWPSLGMYTSPQVKADGLNSGWQLLPDGNYFVPDSAVTQFGTMNYYFLNPALKH